MKPLSRREAIINNPQTPMQKTIETDALFAVGVEPTGMSSSLFSFYKVTENDNLLCLTAEWWADGSWRPRQLRIINSLDRNPRRDICESDAYEEIDEIAWNVLVMALQNAETCEISVDDKLARNQ